MAVWYVGATEPHGPLYRVEIKCYIKLENTGVKLKARGPDLAHHVILCGPQQFEWHMTTKKWVTDQFLVCSGSLLLRRKKTVLLF